MKLNPIKNIIRNILLHKLNTKSEVKKISDLRIVDVQGQEEKTHQVYSKIGNIFISNLSSIKKQHPAV